MYKVFINDKPVFLSADGSVSIEADRKSLKVQCDSKRDLLSRIEHFEKSKRIEKLYVHHNNEKELWKNFKSLYQIIETAGGLVKNSNNEYLFIKRLGKWDLPKGKIEKNEAIETAAVREVSEECGINNLEIIKPLESTYHVYYHNSQYYLKSTYWFLMNYKGSETLIPQQSEGITEVKWVNKKLILSPVYSNTYQNIKLVVESELA